MTSFTTYKSPFTTLINPNAIEKKDTCLHDEMFYTVFKDAHICDSHALPSLDVCISNECIRSVIMFNVGLLYAARKCCFMSTRPCWNEKLILRHNCRLVETIKVVCGYSYCFVLMSWKNFPYKSQHVCRNIGKRFCFSYHSMWKWTDIEPINIFTQDYSIPWTVSR